MLANVNLPSSTMIHVKSWQDILDGSGLLMMTITQTLWQIDAADEVCAFDEQSRSCRRAAGVGGDRGGDHLEPGILYGGTDEELHRSQCKIWRDVFLLENF